ncbi:retrovirus-related pol polyprotein from transposon TNT 1-94 [Tanacetum coccineum]
MPQRLTKGSIYSRSLLLLDLQLVLLCQSQPLKILGKGEKVWDDIQVVPGFLLGRERRLLGNSDEIEKLKTRLKSEFEMKDLGEAKMILGMEIVRDKKLRKLCLTQKQYLRRVLKHDAERAYMKKVPYANAVGSLMYAMICTRPDISHAVGMVSRYKHNPGKGHWQAVKWILRYIHNTVDVGLVFKHGSSQWVEGYCDSDYARDLDKRRSTTGYVFTMAKAPVSWKSTLQSLSTMEAEYMAMTEASAIHLAKNQVYHARTKHIDVRYHFIREILEEGGVRIQKVHTSKNPADMLTKTPPKMVDGEIEEWIFAKVEICKNNVAHVHLIKILHTSCIKLPYQLAYTGKCE